MFFKSMPPIEATGPSCWHLAKLALALEFRNRQTFSLENTASPDHERAMQNPLYSPSARQVCLLLIVGFLAVGEALYLRYLAIEHAPVSLACQAGHVSWLCSTFRLVIVLYNYGVFGWVALVAALLNLVRPSIVLISITLAASGFGLVLHNAGLAGLAVALVILSLARPAPAPE